ncbi:MAG: SDR family NAD(P)-dependent oxidoreductase [Flexilinea sp.]
MKTALITGSSKRLGKSLAIHLADRNYYVWVHYFQDQQAASDVCSQIRSKGGSAEIIRADLTREDEILRMFGEYSSKCDSLDLLINNAAVILSKPLTDTAFDEWNRIFDVNLRAPWFCAINAAKLMGNNKNGLIINIADSGATKNWTKNAAYGISKNALLNLTQVLAKTLAPDIRVNSISPGLILPTKGFKPDQWQRLIYRTLLKKEGQPHDVIQALDFILDASYLTGADIVIDGGYRLVQ